MPQRSRVSFGLAMRGVHIFAVLALTAYIVALATSEWAVYRADIDDRKDPFYARGLWQAYYLDGYGVVTAVSYAETDRDGNRLDPFCGDADLENPLFNERVLDNQTAAVWGKMMGTRDNNSNNWCHKRGTTSILVCLTALASWIAAIISGCAKCKTTVPRKYATAISSLVTAVLALSATCVLGSWLFHERHTVSDEATAFPVNVTGGFSFGAFVVGGCLSFVAAIAVVFDLASNPQPTGQTHVSPLEMDIPPLYQPEESKARLVYNGAPNASYA